MKNKHAILFLAWGEKYLLEIQSCIQKSGKHIEGLDKILITDQATDTDKVADNFTTIIRADFEGESFQRKTEMHRFLPSGYSAFLFLDSDTIVLSDLSLGFEAAENHGIAASPAPNYALDTYWGFEKIMEAEGVPLRGQLQYNTGVIFFSSGPRVMEVFETWYQLAKRHQATPHHDQPYFTLAMEMEKFNPYTLSISYNYRGLGSAISGDVRLWHSHGQMPEKLNVYECAWPPRRAWPGRIQYHRKPLRAKFKRFVSDLKGLIAMYMRRL